MWRKIARLFLFFVTSFNYRRYLKIVLAIRMASISEQPCYTLINYPSENEATSEAKLKEDIGKLIS